MKKLGLYIFHKLPFSIRLPLYKMIRMFKPSEKLYRHLYFTEAFGGKINKSKSFKLSHFEYQSENEIFWSGINGKYEETSLEIWLKLDVVPDTLFDVGANTGVIEISTKGVNNSAKLDRVSKCVTYEILACKP